MVRLTSPHVELLNEEHFEQYSVWVYDDEEDGYLPLSNTDPVTSDYGILFIKATFNSGGYFFNGYLVGIRSFCAFALFVDGEKFLFNLNMKKEMAKDLKKIFKLLNCAPFEFFPLQYSSSVVVCGTDISGFISIKE